MASRGRPVGSKSKMKHALDVRLRKEYGEDFDVIMEMARIAMTTEDRNEKFSMLNQIAPYVTPRLKAVEVTADMTATLAMMMVAPESIKDFKEWQKKYG